MLDLSQAEQHATHDIAAIVVQLRPAHLVAWCTKYKIGMQQKSVVQIHEETRGKTRRAISNAATISIAVMQHAQVNALESSRRVEKCNVLIDNRIAVRDRGSTDLYSYGIYLLGDTFGIQ